MTTFTPAATAAADTGSDSRLWRAAGGFGLAHVLVLLAAFSLEGVAAVGPDTAPGAVLRVYAGLSVDRVRLASYAEAMSFLLLVPALVLLARLFAGRTEAGRAAAGTFVGLGIAYVAATLAVGFPPLTAAIRAAHHGAAATGVAAINDLRTDGFVLQVALAAGFTLALGIAALASRRMTRWAGWGGVALGSVGILVAPFAANAVSLVWMVWWVGVSVLALRGAPRVR